MNYQNTTSIVKPRKLRQGARGARKVKTGCLTCKTRRKKCDERRPACSRCVNAGWKCDFISSTGTMMARPLDERGDGDNEASSLPSPTRSTLRRLPARPILTEIELAHMEYYHLICATEFALYFELPAWETLILQHTLREPALHHAALAIACLTRNRYHPASSTATATASASTSTDRATALSFSIKHYGFAIQTLHTQLARHGGSSVQNLELAALASVVFTLIEFLLGLDSHVGLHLRAGHAVMQDLGRPDIGGGRGGVVPTRAGFGAGDGNSGHGAAGSSYGLLADAIMQLTRQVESFRTYRQARL